MNKAILFFVLCLSASLAFSQKTTVNDSLLEFFADFGVEGSFGLYDIDNDSYTRYNIAGCMEQIIPDATYHLYLVMTAVDAGIVADGQTIVFSRDKEYEEFPGIIGITVKTAFEKQSLLYFRELARKIGRKNMKSFLKSESYGASFSRKGYDECWYTGARRISPNEQLEFLNRLYRNELSFSPKAMEVARNLVQCSEMYDFRMCSIETNTKMVHGTVFSWHIGYAFLKGKPYSFVTAIKSKNLHGGAFLTMAGEITARILDHLGIKPTPPVVMPEPTLDEMIGQMLLVGVNAERVDSSDNTIKAIERGLVGGVILYEKNITPDSSAANLKALTDSLQAYASVPLFICIDQEGGKVNRLKPKYGFPATVTASYLGETDNTDTTRHYADTTAYTLTSLGINVNFAPVVDLGVADNFIKKYGRTFSDDPEKVARHAMEFIAAHRKYGIITTLKHFPGHGSADGDSHLGLVNVTHTWNRSELEPYKIIIDSGMCDGVMTAHILNFRLGTDSLPATLSAQVINGLLRDTLGFDGVVFSDDMQMRAISDFYGMKKAIRLSIEAGVDVLIFSHNIAGTTDQKAERVFNVIKKLVEDGEISRERIEQSYNRIMKLKEKYIIRNI